MAGISGSRAVAESIPQSEVAAVRQNDAIIGAMANYIDDVGYIGLPRGAPDMAVGEARRDVLDVPTEENLERHTSEEDGVSRCHLIIDGVDPVIVPEERADVAEATFRDGREPLRLCIYPGWIL